ncbi:MAG: YtxH domain-containing protein [Myxococcales bacterium]
MKISDIRDLSRDDLLAAMGLQRKSTAMDWIVPGLGLFAVGILVGAGMGLLFAPKSGAQLRSDLADKLSAGEKIPVRVEESVSPGL